MLGVSLLTPTLIAASIIIIALDADQQRSYAQDNQNFSKSVLKEFPVTPGSHPHDVAPATNGEIV